MEIYTIELRIKAAVTALAAGILLSGCNGAQQKEISQEEIFKMRFLSVSGAEELDILMFDYDDYDGNGEKEAFIFCGEYNEQPWGNEYYGTLWFVNEDECISLHEGKTARYGDYGHYRMIDGKMELAPNAKFLYFYMNNIVTANITEIWTVVNGKPEENRFSQIGEVIYRGGSDFEIWMDAYDLCYEPEGDFWLGHTYKPYFYYYDEETAQIEKYAGKIITGDTFVQLCGKNLISEIEKEGYEIGDIIEWENGIVTLNYMSPAKTEGDDIEYDNIIWDNTTKDYWRAKERGVTSWKDAGVGGSFNLLSGNPF